MDAQVEKHTKADLLAMWGTLPSDVDLATAISPMPGKHAGSSYGFDGIRIDGSPEFIKAVLGKLKDLLVMENTATRLSASWSAIAPRDKTEDGVRFGKPDGGLGYCCYIRAATRGPEGGMAMALFDKGARRNAVAFAKRLGIDTDAMGIRSDATATVPA